jgi:hypothetical protein
VAGRVIKSRSSVVNNPRRSSWREVFDSAELTIPSIFELINSVDFILSWFDVKRGNPRNNDANIQIKFLITRVNHSFIQDGGAFMDRLNNYFPKIGQKRTKYNATIGKNITKVTLREQSNPGAPTADK